MGNREGSTGSDSRQSIVRRVLRLGLGYDRGRIALAVALAGLSALAPMLMPLLLSAAIGTIVRSSDQQFVAPLLGWMALVAGIGIVTSLISSRLAIQIGFDLSRQLGTRLFDHVLRMPFLTYATINQGVLTSRLTNDFRLIEPIFVEVPIIAIRSATALAAACLGLAIINPWFLPALVVVPLAVLLVRLAERRINDLIGQSFDLVARISRIIGNSTSDGAVRMMREAGRTSAELADFAEATAASSQLAARLDQWRASIRTSYHASFEIGSIAVLALAVVLAGPGDVGVAGLVSALLYVGLIRQPLSDLVGLRYPIIRATIGLDRVEEVLNSRNAGLPAIVAPSRSRPNDDDTQPVLQFRSVWYRYPAFAEISVEGLSGIGAATPAAGAFGALSLTSLDPEKPSDSAPTPRWTLSNLSLSLTRGEALAIGGTSGSGKTTLVHLACGLLRPTRGAILLGGVDTAMLSEEEIWQQVSLVSQDIYLREGTLRQTLAYGFDGRSDTELLAACEQAGLGATLHALPDGLDTLVGTNGRRFSGGERQRISIARAILKNPRLLILDEATSHLDSAREADVLASIEQLRTSRAVLVVAHRTAALARCDRVMMIGSGRVIETGSHNELMQVGGAYARMHLHNSETSSEVGQ